MSRWTEVCGVQGRIRASWGGPNTPVRGDRPQASAANCCNRYITVDINPFRLLTAEYYYTAAAVSYIYNTRLSPSVRQTEHNHRVYTPNNKRTNFSSNSDLYPAHFDIRTRRSHISKHLKSLDRS